MSDEEGLEEFEEKPRYKAAALIDYSALATALSQLRLLGDDPYLRMQAWNLAIVDKFITGLEYDVLERLIDEERTPVETYFVCAVGDMVKWADCGGLKQKLAELEKDAGYPHFGRAMRAHQIRKVLADTTLIEKVRQDLKRICMLFVRLEAIRMCLAKHEVWKRGGSIALSPGYGRINSWCGSMDYELENGRYSMGYINRRDIADAIRALPGNVIPDDAEIKRYKEYLRGQINIPLD